MSDAAIRTFQGRAAVSNYHVNRRGIIAFTAACGLFTVADTVSKLGSLYYPTGEVLFARAMASMVCIGVVVLWTQKTTWLRYTTNRYVLLRAVLDALSNVVFILALSHMRIADLLAVNLVSPLLLTLVLVCFFGERIGWRRWSAILVGFAGVLLIVRPSPDSMNDWALLGLVSAACSAVRDVVTRRIDPAIPTLAVAFVSIVAVALAALLMAPVFNQEWRVPSLGYVALFAGGGLFLSIGSTLAVSAFRNSDISVVAPFRYSLLIWGALAGYLTFGEVSDLQSLLGALLIVLSGIYSLHRERVRHRALTAKAGIH
jgi:drug/metabolite transporter (DMT)-like permease